MATTNPITTTTQPQPGSVVTQSAAKGRAANDPWGWKFCDCLGAAVCCCECVVAGQLYERLVKPGSCKVIVGGYTLMMVFAALLALIAVGSSPMNATLYQVATWLGWLTHLALVAVMVVVRVAVRKRDGIPTAVEGDPCVEDCLCLVCCAPFAQCQVARQEYDAATYAFVSLNGADAV